MKNILKKKITLGIWSIKVFKTSSYILNPPTKNLDRPTIQATDVTDLHAEFVADPFILYKDPTFYMFFEVLDKSSNKGVIGLATSEDGDKWNYDRIVLNEKFHLSYPYVFKYNNEFYMIPESSESKKVLLYKAKNFPYDWSVVSELIEGSFVDCSVFNYNNRWWMFGGKRGRLHLFFSDKIDGNWREHPSSPIISNNSCITRPGGRVIENNNILYRYAQDGNPNYGSALRIIKIKKISETEYEEEESNLLLKGTKSENDWRKDGMHTIDQLQISKDQWLIAVDGHTLKEKNYLLWKFQQILCKLK